MTNIECPKCGGTLAGDWNEVECRKCGQRFNTLDVASPVIRELNAYIAAPEISCYVSRLAKGGVLVAAQVGYGDGL